MSIRFAVAGTSAALLLALSGCGGDGDSAGGKPDYDACHDAMLKIFMDSKDMDIATAEGGKLAACDGIDRPSRARIAMELAGDGQDYGPAEGAPEHP
ncbi:hypothetical protein SRB5_28540 [Streptomyces sp. RB5]|uniref:Lipoprotein n=1 Tax=Streptomyces smaragdinus TaxID=2585196 RepID=A0A7K0CGW0_9ACTN|nr:hypothetical protein [Streptomyces smaragdinus]MQY12715.1 hypothetical protein [Streptomyces smaragdinus]